MEYGCIGQKLTHSFSKTIHNKLCDYKYELCELTPQELEKFMTERAFRAINVTIPYKQDVIPYLDSVSDRAREIGAVNTIVTKNGRLYGYNTDFLGLRALAEKNSIDFRDKKVVILGSGGTSKTAQAAARAGGAAKVLRVSRTARDGCIDYETLYGMHADAQILVNTTPCGMFPSLDGAAADLDRLPNICGVLDAVYNPLRSKLIMQALYKKIPASGGLYMLVAQAAFAAEKFINTKFSKEDIDRVYKGILSEKENVVLTGMPGCGKTTLGQRIAKTLEREFIDIDREIVSRENMPITEIFSRGGEPLFREIETRVIKEVSAKSGIVIATGGGAVLRAENVRALRQNGRICFIDRPIDTLPTTDSRPLSSDRQKLRALYDTRLPIYKKTCDFEVSGAEGIEKTTEIILKEYGFES